MRSFVLPLLLLPALLTAQSILYAPRDARSLAAGGTAVAESGLPALGINPAAAAGAGLEAAANYHRPFGLSELGSGSAGITYRHFGLLLSSLATDGYAETLVMLAYGRELNPRLRLGGEFGMLRRTTRGYGSEGRPTAGVGLQYDLTPDLTLGLAGRGELGRGSQAGRLHAGLRYRLNAEVLLSVEEACHSLENCRTRLGMRYRASDPLMLYLGVVTNLPELTFGVGWGLTNDLYATFAAGVHQYLGVSPFFGLAFRPGPPPGVGKPERPPGRFNHTAAGLQ